MTVALRMVPPRTPSRLGPNEALRLGILGPVSAGSMPLEELIDAAGEVGGACWRPTADVLLCAIEDMIGRGYLALSETAAPGVSPVVSLTTAGRVFAAELMRIDLVTAGDHMCHTLILMKVAFLDLLEPAARWRELDAMVDLLRERLATRRRSARRLRGCGRYLFLALGQELREMEAEIAWLAALRDTQLRTEIP